jgi:hypothetical protein
MWIRLRYNKAGASAKIRGGKKGLDNEGIADYIIRESIRPSMVFGNQLRICHLILPVTFSDPS